MPFLDNDGVTRLTTDYLDVFARKEDAILDPSGGLIRTDDGISVDSLTRESDGAISGSIVELTAEGHAEQFSTTGKNLLDPTTQRTVSGITVTPRSDGSYVVSGTATQDAIINTSFAEPLLAGTYTLSAGNAMAAGTSNDTYIRVSISSSGVSQSQVALNVANNATTFTVSNPLYMWTIRVASGDTLDNLVIYPQLELGSTATSYEPYTGGAPSPSPDYPQEIKVVRGRNLAESISDSANGKRIVGYNAGNTNRFPKVSCNLSAGTYTISLDVRSVINSPKFGEIRLWVRDASDGVLYNVNVSTGEKSTEDNGGTSFIGGYSEAIPTVFNRKSGVVKLGFAVSEIVFGLYHSSTYIEYRNLQLTLGSTPQPYVPYGYVGMEVQGKNLFNPSHLLTVSDWTKSDGVYTGPSANLHTAFTNGYPDLTFEQDSQYTFSFDFDYSGEAGVAVSFVFVYSDGTQSETYFNQKNHHYAVVSTSGKTVSKLILSYGTSRTVRMSNIQLELGSEATEYEPYHYTTTPVPLPQRGWVAGLPDCTADVLTLDGAGKVEWEERCNEKKFSELNWRLESGYSIARFGTTIVDKRKPSSFNVRASDLMSDCYIADGDGAIAGNVDHRISGYQNGSEIYLTDSDYSDTQAFLSARGNATVLYPLATPITEDCGYVEDWPTDIPEGATISIPELDALNVKYFVDGSAGTLARQWYKRTQDSDIADVEDAIGDLTSVVANLVTHDQFYFGYDEVNGKKMISIFKRGDI